MAEENQLTPTILGRVGSGPVLLPQALDGESWQVTERELAQIKVDPIRHLAQVPLPVTEGISQARYHELARIQYAAESFPPTSSGQIAQSLDELRLDLLLEARGIPQGNRMDDLNWAAAPNLTDLRSYLRFLCETAYPAARGESPLLQERWQRVQEKVQTERPLLGERLVRGLGELKDAAYRGEDGCAERDHLAHDLGELLEPPLPPPPAVTPSSLSREATKKVAEAHTPPTPKAPPPTSRKKLQKKEVPSPKPDPKDRDEDDLDLDGEATGSESEAKPEEVEGEEYEEVEDDEAAARAAQQDALTRSLAKRVGDKEALAVFDPTGRIGHGGVPKIGMMVIHDHLNKTQKTHMIRRTAGARDRGQIPAHWHRYTMDRAIFSHRRAGGTVLIDGSGSMNWDPDKLEKVMQHLPLATIAIYHGSSVDWEMASKIGITRTPSNQLYEAGLSFQERDTLSREIHRIQAENSQKIREAGLGESSPSYAIGPVTERFGQVNGTLCILGRDGRWGPMAHDRGSGNDVDVEALQWLAGQKPPRIWISDGRVMGGLYEMLGLNLEAICAELSRRHKITRVRKVSEALKLLGFRIPELERLGV